MGKSKRGKVWLAVSGLVTSGDGKWLLVKKKYGGLKGKWSIPAGFVEEGETVDQAVLREVFEETGVKCKVKGLIGVRTGVIDDEISDNMLLFLLEPDGEATIKIQDSELFDVKFIDPNEIIDGNEASVLVEYLLKNLLDCLIMKEHNGINPGDQFGYTSYKLFL